MANRFVLTDQREFTDGGLAPDASATLDFYTTGTFVRLDTFTDNALAVAHANPVVADSAGRFPEIFMQDAEYRVVLTVDTVQKWQRDLVHGGFGVVFGSQLITATGTSTARSLANWFADAHNVFQEIPQAEHAAILAGTSTFDASTAIQTSIDAAAADATAIGGGAIAVPVLVPSGLYNANVTIKQGVWLKSLGGRWTTRIKAVSGAPIIDSPVGATFNCGVEGLSLDGNSLVGSLGVRFRNVTRGVIKGCFLNLIDQQGILWEDGNASIFEDNFAQNCLLDRVHAVKVGVIEAGTLTADGNFVRGEYTASLGGTANKSDANLRLCAGLIKGSDHFMESGVYETSDIGLRIEAANCQMINVRADLNQGHGFEVTGNGVFANMKARNNGRDLTNTYDGFFFDGGGGEWSNCQSQSVSTPFQRFGYNSNLNSDSNKSTHFNCLGSGNATALWNTAGFAGAAVTFSDGPRKSFVSLDATPSVEAYKQFETNNAGATTITDFDDGVSGQEIVIFAGDANTTLNFAGANLIGNLGVDRKLAQNDTVTFVNHNGPWYETGAQANYGAHTAIGAETVTGFITITDSGGTSRKVAIVS